MNFDWWNKIMYVSSPRDPDPFFHPREYGKSKAEVVKAAEEVIAGLPQWKIESYKEIQGKFSVVRWTKILPFADDINIYIVQGLDGITRVEMTGQTRVGRRDWGRNRRNIREFLTRLDAKLSLVRSQN